MFEQCNLIIFSVDVIRLHHISPSTCFVMSLLMDECTHSQSVDDTNGAERLPRQKAGLDPSAFLLKSMISWQTGGTG